MSDAGDPEVVGRLTEPVGIDSVNPSLVPGAPGEARIVDYLGTRLTQVRSFPRALVEVLSSAY